MKKLLIALLSASMILVFAIPSFADYNEKNEPVSVKEGEFNGSPAQIDGNGNLLINNVNFPDNIFKEYISKEYDLNKDNLLTIEECSEVRGIYLRTENISTVKGVEYFTEITSLDCEYTQLTNLDVSKNTKLTYLSCGATQLTSLDVNKNMQLEYLYCDRNQLASLDISKNTHLKTLFCQENKLTSLDVSKNTRLIQFGCQNNQLASLDVSKNLLLEDLICSSTKLTSLDVSKNLLLEDLICSAAQLTSLDVSKNTQLTLLWCHDNQLASLDISKNNQLNFLWCSNNQLTSLDVSKNMQLKSLFCDGNQLTSLDVSKNTQLKRLECSDNRLTSLDLSTFNEHDSSNVSPSNINRQLNTGKYLVKDGKYLVDLTQFKAVNPDKVTVTDGGIKSGNIVTYDTLPQTMTYNYSTDSSVLPQMEDVVITLEGPQVYTVTFDIDGGSTIDSQEVIEGDTIVKPEDPIKPGVTFGGWLDENGSTFDFSTVINRDIVLYANWTANEDGTNKVDTGKGNTKKENDKNKGNNIIKTGDSDNMVIWLMVALTAAMAVGAVALAKRESEK